MRVLTERQGAVLDFIKLYIHDKVRPPTLREIGKRFGIISTNAVNCHLQALERKGYITRDPRLSRSITIVPVVETEPRTAHRTGQGQCPRCGRSGRAA